MNEIVLDKRLLCSLEWSFKCYAFLFTSKVKFVTRETINETTVRIIYDKHGDSHVTKFIEMLGFDASPLRRKKVAFGARHAIFHNLYGREFRNGLVLFAAQIYHKCNIEKTSNHLMFRGPGDRVNTAVSKVEKLFNTNVDCKVPDNICNAMDTIFPDLADKLSSRTKHLLNKYIVALQKYYTTPMVISFFKDFNSVYIYTDKEIDDSIIMQNGICSSTSEFSTPEVSTSNSDEENVLDKFKHMRQKYKHLPAKLKVMHPMVYPELYDHLIDNEYTYIGRKHARQFILDGSNVAFAHGQFQKAGYLPTSEYKFDENTCQYSMIGLKLVCEELWKEGAFYYPLYENKNWENDVVDVVISMCISRSKQLFRVPEYHQVILEQFYDIETILQNRVIIAQIDSVHENEDLFILDYAIQTNGAIVTNDKFRDREAFVLKAHNRYNFANQDMTMCRKRIVQHFFSSERTVRLTPRDASTARQLKDIILDDGGSTKIDESYSQQRKMSKRKI